MTNRLSLASQGESFPVLTVDANGLQNLVVAELDANELRFDFLTGFHSVAYIIVNHVDNVARTVPSLPGIAGSRQARTPLD